MPNAETQSDRSAAFPGADDDMADYMMKLINLRGPCRTVQDRVFDRVFYLQKSEDRVFDRVF